MARHINIGDEVTINATILRLYDNNGRASVSIPTSDFPYSIDAPKKAKPGDKLPLTGLVMRIDDQDRKSNRQAQARELVRRYRNDWRKID
jgi:hypothetical protein